MNALSQYQRLLAAGLPRIHRQIYQSPPEQLQQLAQFAAEFPDDVNDAYGRGGAVAALEQQLANLFGMPAALWLPTGTLAQPLALKLHAQQRQNLHIGLHPSSHLLLHEHDGYQHLWGLRAVPLGAPERLLELADLEACEQPLSAVVLELPAREIGGQLPSWQALKQQVQWARERGTAVHFDGARLWQCSAAYQRSLAELAGLADSVYVSLYKDLGAIAGAALLASEDFIAEARIWARRAGGNVPNSYPLALSALAGLQQQLGLVNDAVAYAPRLADALRQMFSANQLRIVPEPPQAAMLHLWLPIPAESLLAATVAYAEREQVLVLPPPRQQQQDWSCCEISIGSATLSRPPLYWAEHLQQLLKPLLGSIDSAP